MGRPYRSNIRLYSLEMDRVLFTLLNKPHFYYLTLCSEPAILRDPCSTVAVAVMPKLGTRLSMGKKAKANHWRVHSWQQQSRGSHHMAKYASRIGVRLRRDLLCVTSQQAIMYGI
jgi:hypothetical protein